MNKIKKESKTKETKIKKQEKPCVTKEMTIGEVVTRTPETALVFLEHGMHCVGCAVANSETIEQGAAAHGINAEELVDDLNKIVSHYKKKK